MAKRDKVLSEENVGSESSTTPTELTTSASDEVTEGMSPEMAALHLRIQAQEKRLAESEADKAKAEAKAAEAAERLRLMAQAQAARPSSVLTSAILEDRPLALHVNVKENERTKVSANQVRKAQGSDLGDASRTVVCSRLHGCGRSEVQVTLPDRLRLAHGVDAYIAVFEGSRARVPQVVAEILCAEQPHRYQLTN